LVCRKQAHRAEEKRMRDQNTTTRGITVSISGLWLIGWLFTIGYADLTFWRGVLAFLIWPVFAGGAAH
jgi:hypothetical protein